MLLGWIAIAFAAPEFEDPAPAWWRGVVLADVEMQARDGSLPEEDLEPLLRVKEGQPLDPAAIQADLATLYRVGNFRAVEASVQPWPLVGADGTTRTAVQLTYEVYGAPEIARITIQQNKAFSDRELLDVSGLVDGQEFYADLDGPPVAERLENWLARQGYPEARVSVRATAPEPGLEFVNLAVEEGLPDIVESIVFVGDLSQARVSEKQLRRWAKRSGLEVGKPLVNASLKDTRERIKRRLGSVQRSAFRKTRGLVEARVITLAAGPVGSKQITVTIEPGARLEVEANGISFRDVRRALSIDDRLRLTRGFLDQAPEAVTRYLQERSWYAADVEVELEETPTVNTLRVTANRGSKHTIGPRLPFPHRLGSSHAGIELDFDITDAKGRTSRLERDLQALFFLASPDVLGRHHYTKEAMEAGRNQARQFFVKRGHLDAEVTVLEPEIRARRSFAAFLARLRGEEPRRKIRPRIVVTQGPVTELADLRIENLAEEVVDRARDYLDQALGKTHPRELSDEDIERWAVVILGGSVQDRLVGGPFSPQRIEALRELLVVAHQAEGYLEAEARVVSTEVAERRRQTVITVDPGPRVLLRSIATQGRRRTKRGVIVNTIDLKAGQPLRATASPTPSGDKEPPRNLEDVRNDLYGLGAFKAVVLQAVGDEVNRDLLVRVSEQSRWRFEPGLGVSTDQGLRLLFNGTRENLFGLTHRLRAQLLGSVDFQGPQFDTLASTFNPPELRASLEYTAPRFPLKAQDFVADLVLRDWRQERTWRLTRTGGGLRVLTNLGRRERTQIGAGVRLEFRGLSQVAPAIVLEGEPWTPREDDDGAFQGRYQSTVTGQFVWDQRNDPINPTRGLLLSLNGEYVPGIRFGDRVRTSFLKGEARFSGFRRVTRSGILLKTTGRAGYIRMLTDTSLDARQDNAVVPPLEDRFRLGGTGSLRGFRRHGVGPHNRGDRLIVQSAPLLRAALGADPDPNEGDWVPTGGDTLAVFGAELLMPLPAFGATAWDGYSLAAFVEVGNVWLLNLPDDLPPVTSDSIDGMDAWRNANPFLRWSFGIGGRRDTPVGPIQIDLAFNPQALGLLVPTATQSFVRNQLGEGTVRLHITLGELF
ncbi:MAG: BamA/TamA family outer membrane protein [Myxococcota bacterium]